MSDEREAKIRKALTKLDPEDAGDWTDGGLPALGQMQKLSGLNDLKRDEIGRAQPGFNRDTAKSAPSVLPGSQSDATKNAAPTDTGEAAEDPEKADTGMLPEEELINPNLAPEDNPNVGRDDLGPYEGQAHTSDQHENLRAQIATEDAEEGAMTAQALAESVDGDAILLLEAACIAASGQRYQRNSYAQNIVRHYSVEQVALKDQQARLDKQDADRSERNRRADEAEAKARKARG